MGKLTDDAYYRQVRIHPLLPDTVMWPEEQDIAPHELYALSTPLEQRGRFMDGTHNDKATFPCVFA